ncbi:uncharacterized F-box/LRR-repeat protein C02F5.7-like [Papaver somniferum]|uniref:uncharacterized F-box/LRR-repeat protein C02F5.7-like n=1 Tax=Papaver somniferum TaxID=3469 RepID=UPI000E700975|nr:uncharacterized F-box/LRR-repeat protein C02F5.7-like [Papaver somniferum]
MVMSKRILNEKFLIQWFGKANNDDRPCKIRRIFREDPYLSAYQLTEDRNSFGLTCRQWLHIQNNNREHLWFLYPKNKCAATTKPSIHPESFHVVFCKLLQCNRYWLSRVCTNSKKSYSRRVQTLSLLPLDELPNAGEGSTDTEAVLKISEGCPLLKKLMLPNCEDVELEGWEAISWNCKNLEHLTVSGCQNLSIGSLLVDNMKHGHFKTGDVSVSDALALAQKQQVSSHGEQPAGKSLTTIEQPAAAVERIKESEEKLAAVGESELEQLSADTTLTNLEAKGCRFIPEGFRAIVSCGGLKCLRFSTINTEAVRILSKGCPLLKNLNLSNCEDMGLQGSEAIGRNYKNLEHSGAESYVISGCKLWATGVTSFPNFL